MKFKYKNEHEEVSIFEIIEGSTDAVKQAYKEDIEKLSKHSSLIASKMLKQRQKSLTQKYIKPPNGFDSRIEVWGIVKNKEVITKGNYNNNPKTTEQELSSELGLNKIRRFKKSSISQTL